LIPTLHFSEFQESWLPSVLGDIAKFSKGKGLSKSELDPDGKISCVRYGELYTRYGETISQPISKTNTNITKLVLSEANDVIIPASGETQIDIATASCIMTDGVALGGDLNIIKTSHDGVFLSYYLNSKRKHDIARLSQGISVVHLYASQLARLTLRIPSLREQQKIAAFLSAVDKKIQLLQLKKKLLGQYKKGAMQKIFSQEIRFKDEDGNDYPDWEERQLRDMDIYIADGNYGELYPKSDEMKSEGVPFIRANNIKDLQLVWDDMKFIDEKLHMTLKSGHLKFDDVLVTTRGEIGMVAYVDKPFEYANINAQICLLRCGPSVSSYFLLQYLHSAGGKKQFKRYETGSALKQLPKKSLGTIKIPVPRIDEQTLIADFLKTIDGKLLSIRKQIAVVIQFKKGLLQQMFV
jgi:type I restriction enzyme, S subunit